MTTKELTSGNPLKLIILFMLPIFFGNLFQQLYSFIDALIVGRTIGIEALGAIGAVQPLIFLVISFIFASTQGFSVVTAQNFGARNYDKVRKSASASFILSFILMIIMTLISTPFTRIILEFLNTPKDILPLSESYLFIMFGGIFATVFYNVTSNLIRALGDSKTPLYFLIFSSFLNIFLDLLFILKFNMGIKGAAYATVLSQGISTIFCIIFMYYKFPLLRLKKEDWKVEKEFLIEHIKVGIPMGFQMSILTIGIIGVQYVLNTMGSIAVTAFTTAVRIDQLFSQALLAIGATMATYTAQNFGAKEMLRIRQGAKSAVLLCFLISTICIIVLTTFGEKIISLFMETPNFEVIKLAKQYLNVVIVFFFFLGCIFIYRNILQGMGRVTTPLLTSITELIARVSAAFILGAKFGYIGVCLASPFAWIMGALVLYVGYKINIQDLKKQGYEI